MESFQTAKAKEDFLPFKSTVYMINKFNKTKGCHMHVPYKDPCRHHTGSLRAVRVKKIAEKVKHLPTNLT